MADSGRDPGDAELERLFAAVREDLPDLSAVDRGFEARVMARIREWREPWHVRAWKLAPVFLALTLLFAGSLRYLAPVQPAGALELLGSGLQDSALLAHLAGE